MKRTIAVGVAASAMLIGPAALANASEQHHETKAEKRHDRRVEARKDRRAERAAPRPPQGTTTDSAPRAGVQGKPAGVRTGGTPGGSVVSCGVSADRAGASFTVHNGCDTPQTVTISVQSQPGPWHVGLCTAGGCTLLQRYDLNIQPGTHTISAQSSACYYQVDVKWDGRLIRSNHYVTSCKPVVPPSHPKPKPRVQTHPVGHKHPGHVEGHLTQPPGQLAYTASSFDLPLIAGLGGLLILSGTAVTLAAPLRRYTRRTKR